MKTNITIINIDGVETIAKFIGTFLYHEFPKVNPEPRIGKVFQTLSSSYITVYEDGVVKMACAYDIDECEKYTEPHGGKHFRKKMRKMRTAHNLTKNNLPF